MNKTKVQVSNRKLVGKKVKQLRKQNQIPGVIFGMGKKSEPISITSQELNRLYETAGESGLLELEVNGGQLVNAIISEVQKHPLTEQLIHVNFRQVNLTEKISTKVPVVLEGEAPIVKTGEGIALHLLNEIEVTCLPQDIPHEIRVDITTLTQIDAALQVKDLPIDHTKVQLEADPEDFVVKIDYAQQPEEIEEAEISEADLVGGVEATRETALDGDENTAESETLEKES